MRLATMLWVWAISGAIFFFFVFVEMWRSNFFARNGFGEIFVVLVLSVIAGAAVAGIAVKIAGKVYY